MIPTVPWQERLWIRYLYVYLGIQLHVQKTWLVFCVRASLYVSFVLWCKKLFASPRYTCLEPWLFCCITGCEEFLKQQQKEVEVLMENPIRPLIQYGGFVSLERRSSFCHLQKRLRYGSTRARRGCDTCLQKCLKWKGFKIHSYQLLLENVFCKCLVNVIRLGHEPQSFWMIGERQIATSPAVEWNELFPSFWVSQDECKNWIKPHCSVVYFENGKGIVSGRVWGLEIHEIHDVVSWQRCI